MAVHELCFWVLVVLKYVYLTRGNLVCYLYNTGKTVNVENALQTILIRMRQFFARFASVVVNIFFAANLSTKFSGTYFPDNLYFYCARKSSQTSLSPVNRENKSLRIKVTCNSTFKNKRKCIQYRFWLAVSS